MDGVVGREKRKRKSGGKKKENEKRKAPSGGRGQVRMPVRVRVYERGDIHPASDVGRDDDTARRSTILCNICQPVLRQVDGEWSMVDRRRCHRERDAGAGAAK